MLNQGSRSSFDHHLYDILFKNSSIGKSSQEIDSDITHMSSMVWSVWYDQTVWYESEAGVPVMNHLAEKFIDRQVLKSRKIARKGPAHS